MSRLLHALVIVCLCLALLPTSSITEAQLSVERGVKREERSSPSTLDAPRSSPYVPGEVIVKLRDGATLSRGLGKTCDAPDRCIASRVGARQSARAFPAPLASHGDARPTAVSDLSRAYRLKLDETADVMAAVAKLSADPDVEYAEPNYIAWRVESGAWSDPSLYPPRSTLYSPQTVPNDPLLPGQWGLTKINAASAWDVVTGTSSVVFAVVDSGIDTTHADLAGQLWTNPGEIPGNGIDDDNNGYVDDVNGWNFVSGSSDISDGNGHGTQVAGIIAAATNNGVGIAGLCWNCRTMPVKVMADSGASNYSDIAAGVAYAANKGAKVINLSLGGYSDSRTLQDAIASAVSQGAAVVGGAGNDNVSTPFYPAAYSNVLAVAATTATDSKTAFSNYGTWVDVSAPGEAITTTFLGGDYGPASGTSMSAPFAAGLAGLIRSRWPAWTEAMVRNQILRTVDSVDAANPTYAGQLGVGRINAGSAMQESHPLLAISGASVNGDSAGRPTPGQSATLAVTLRNDWQDATGVTGVLSTADAYVTFANDTAAYGSIASGGTGTGSPVDSFTVASGAGYNHPIAFTLAVTANAGAYTTTIPLTITTRSGDEPFCGTVTEDVTWTNDKTYIIGCNVGIAPGYTLTIQPGTVIKFSGNYALDVGGTLIADGTADQPIRFTNNCHFA